MYWPLQLGRNLYVRVCERERERERERETALNCV